jgi:hypothetical protein
MLPTLLKGAIFNARQGRGWVKLDCDAGTFSPIMPTDTDLFRPFEELADGTGVGLGLAFSRWGVEVNDGRISARNLPDQGCVFTIDLPRFSAPAVVMVQSGSTRAD